MQANCSDTLVSPQPAFTTDPSSWQKDPTAPRGYPKLPIPQVETRAPLGKEFTGEGGGSGNDIPEGSHF